jgi:AcrR family transcriptional regulator
MDASFNSGVPSMPPLPAALQAALHASLVAGPKRERTQSLLLQAAVQVIAERGLAATTMQQVAQAAGMAPGTVYNHFATREDLVARLAVVIGLSLSRVIAESSSAIEDGAQRMAIGQRRYVWLAAESPAWALLLLDVGAASPHLLATLEGYILADLRLGVKQKRFKVPSEAAAMDVINGVCTSAMRRVAMGAAPPRHDIAAASLVLRALGLPPDEALEVARRPLPELPMPAPAPPAAARRPRAR